MSVRRYKEKNAVTIFWFRRDLRLEDNVGLYYALKTRENVLPVFIFDSYTLDQIEDKQDARIVFVYQQLQQLRKQLEKYGAGLHVAYGQPLAVFQSLCEKYHVCNVYANSEYEPYSRQRDELVEEYLQGRGIDFIINKDQVIFEKDELLNAQGKPYIVFTPYKRKFLSKLNKALVRNYDAKPYFYNFFRSESLPFPSLEEMGFEHASYDFPDVHVSGQLLELYGSDRDFPARNGTSRVGIHLRFGTVSIRKITAKAMMVSPTFLSELIWRNFYMTILWFYPQVVTRSFKPKYDEIRWENNQVHFDAWCAGKTGYPMVDAGMRELNQTGYMHNRLRMVTASFLCKHLLIDWRWGEAYFASKLLDFDLAANNGGWQWAAGSGCDAAPYFRIFNPELQARKFDPEMEYIRKWVPEIESPSYPKPIVEHRAARQRALERYGEVLQINA